MDRPASLRSMDATDTSRDAMTDAPLFIGLARRPADRAARVTSTGRPVHDPSCRFALGGARTATLGAFVLLSCWPLGTLGLTGLGGCASAPAPTEFSRGDRASNAPADEIPATSAPRRDRVVFSDEPDPERQPPRRADSSRADSGADASDGSLVAALADSYRDDRAALAEMQRSRDEDRRAGRRGTSPEARPASRSLPEPEPEPEPEFEPQTEPESASESESEYDYIVELDPPPTVPASSRQRTPHMAPPVEAPTGAPLDVPVAAPVPSRRMPESEPAGAPVPPPLDRTGGPGEASVTPSRLPDVPVAAPAATAVATTPTTSTSSVGVNAAIELPSATPTDPAALARLLADALVRRSETADDPTRDWIAYAALALAEPSLELPEGFGTDLLPAERERIVKLRAGFAAIGRALAAKPGAWPELDRRLVDDLAFALSGGPKLEIPKLEICNRVERFGRYEARTDNRFFARSNARFIAYVELDGFASALEDGQFVTRLATRISIESARDEIEVWTRSPEWTPVVDTSPVRREEFFVGEIVPLSEHLGVGAYRLKVEVRDESTGAVAVATYPLQVVADSVRVPSAE